MSSTRDPLDAALAPHRRGDGDRLLDALALAWAGGPTLAQRHAVVRAHLATLDARRLP